MKRATYTVLLVLALADLCDQVCGVGEACLCKRCQVLGCGV